MRLEFYLAQQEFPPLDTIKEHILTHSGQAAKKVNQYRGKDLEASFIYKEGTEYLLMEYREGWIIDQG